MKGFMKILVIDDEQLIRQTLSYVAQERGHECQTAETGEQGVSIWKSWQPDLVFLDVMLPDFNGFSVIEKTPLCSVVLMSAYGQLRDKAFEKGATLFLTKPFEDIYKTFDDVMVHFDQINQRKTPDLDYF